MATLVSVCTHTNSGETPGTTHTYTVKAFDAAGNYSAASNTISATTTTDSTPPAKVLGLKGTSGSKNAMTISWNHRQRQRRGGQLQDLLNGVFATSVPAPTISQFYSGLSNSTTYNITVYAKDAAGNVSPVSANLACVVSSSGNAGSIHGLGSSCITGPCAQPAQQRR